MTAQTKGVNVREVFASARRVAHLCDPMARAQQQPESNSLQAQAFNLLSELDAAEVAVAVLIDALREAHYCGLMIGEDCAWALASLQRDGKYKPTCSDGRPSKADAARDHARIRKCRELTRAALARFGSQP